jgi:nicotinate-nucleotide pyrophosphorylase (carboxylating)
MFSNFEIDAIILSALKEDMPFGDITTENTIGDQVVSRARLIAKETGIIAGLQVAERAFSLLDSQIVFNRKINDGDAVVSGDVIAEIEGSAQILLKGERTALNFLQRLSGVATATSLFLAQIKDIDCKLVDTRKTTPGLRVLEKYAVRVGGGHNHRYSLSDGVLIKDNHIVAAGGIKNAVERVRLGIAHTIKIEVETESLEQVQEALCSGADIIMLDNMSLEQMEEAVRFINKRAMVEASGNVSLDNIREIAKTGVDIISVGKLTHSAMAFDISMRML